MTAGEKTRRLSSGTRLALAVAVGVLVVGGISIGAVAATISRVAMVEVEVVENDGGHVSLRVPGSLIDVGVRLVPAMMLGDAAREIEPWWPVVHAAWEGLEDCPDVTLVEVDGPHEKVRVVKRGDVLVIHVDDSGARVFVSVPIRTLNVVMDRLDDAIDA